MALTFNHHGISLESGAEALAALMSDVEVLLVGDTKHRNPAIKKAVFDALPALKNKGCSKLWIEFSTQKQRELDILLAVNSPVEALTFWVPALCPKETASQADKKNWLARKRTFGEGIYHAHHCGMQVALIDDKETLYLFKEKNPEFISVQDRIRGLYASGYTLDLAEEEVLSTLSPTEKQAYLQKEMEWKSIRDGQDECFASKIVNATGRHAKQVVIVGDGHFNTQDDVDNLLDIKGISNCTLHIYDTLASYGEYLSLYIDNLAKDGKPRDLPDAVYLLDTGKCIQPDHPYLASHARNLYYMTQWGVVYFSPRRHAS